MDKQFYENLPSFNNTYTIKSSDCPKSFPPHWHKKAELLFLPPSVNKSSLAKITIQQKEYVLHPGCMCIIWPGELHEITDNSEQNLVALQFPLSVLNNCLDMANFIERMRTCHMFYLYKEPLLCDAVWDILQSMISLRDEHLPFPEVSMLIRLYELFMTFGNFPDLQNFHAKENKKLSVATDTLAKIQDSCLYIQLNCNKDLNLEQMATLYGFSSCYFSRCFKQVTSYHFVEYLTLQRIKRVQTLLAEESISISEAAFQAGFNSLSTFNRVFSKYNGCSPKEYKNYYRKTL